MAAIKKYDMQWNTIQQQKINNIVIKYKFLGQTVNEEINTKT